jgi:hypothetical protein
MPFLPTNTVLGTTDEFKNISYTVTYEQTSGGVGGSPGTTTTYSVTLTAIDANDTINVTGNTISGYYSESFVHDIQYRTPEPNHEFINVEKFEQIDKTKLSELIYYKADIRRSRDYQYLASANGQTQIYTVTVTNNWNTGRDQLISYVNQTQYKLYTITWINMNNEPIVWVNGLNQPMNWISTL